MDPNSQRRAPTAAPPSATPPRDGAADDAIWQAVTVAANAAYVARDLRRALDLYHSALDEAERLFALASKANLSVPAPVIYNISSHNLAEMAAQLGDEDSAEEFLVRAYDKLRASAASPETPLPLRLDCARHLKHGLALLVQHLHARAAPDAKIATYVEQAQAAAFAVFHAAKHAETARLNCDHPTVRPS